MSDASATEALRARLEATPFARFLGVQIDLRGDELTLALPYKDELIGNIMLPALHGGAVGALLELTAVATVALRHGGPDLPKTVDIAIDYLRSGRPAPTFARATVNKMGRRVASVSAEAWQYQRADPTALLRGHFLLPAS